MIQGGQMFVLKFKICLYQFKCLKRHEIVVSFDINFIGSIGSELSELLSVGFEFLDNLDVSDFEVNQGLSSPFINFHFNLSCMFFLSCNQLT